MEINTYTVAQKVKLESKPGEMKKMSDVHIFLSRLKLLMIMAKAYLNGCPLGKYRKQAVIENANYVFYHFLHLADESAPSIHHDQDIPKILIAGKKFSNSHMFRKKVQLLAVITRSIAGDHPLDQTKQELLRNTLNRLSKALTFNFQINRVNFLKVA